MKKNWYAVFTKPNCEKKAATLLLKKGIKAYCPVNNRGAGQQRKKALPDVIFPGFVFVYVSDPEMAYIRQTISMVSFVYWLGKPAVIKETEIEKIIFCENELSDIKIIKTTVNQSAVAKLTEEPAIYLDNKLLTGKNITVKLTLPSIGYLLVAQSEKSVIVTQAVNTASGTMLSQQADLNQPVL